MSNRDNDRGSTCWVRRSTRGGAIQCSNEDEWLRTAIQLSLHPSHDQEDTNQVGCRPRPRPRRPISPPFADYELYFQNDSPDGPVPIKIQQQQHTKKYNWNKRKSSGCKRMSSEITRKRKVLKPNENNTDPTSHWVRRSVRQPHRSELMNPNVLELISKLRTNHPDVVVLKLKRYIGPDTPQLVMDAILDALLDNSNCQALYIQNFNEGMRDEQMMRLLKVLENGNIWCLNVGETYKVKTRTWEKFTEGLVRTSVTHTYASEHTISIELKDKIREIIRENRKKHDRHNNPENLDVIVQCTHCWWNPFNAKRLKPFLGKYVNKYNKEHDTMEAEVESTGSSAKTEISAIEKFTLPVGQDVSKCAASSFLGDEPTLVSDSSNQDTPLHDDLNTDDEQMGGNSSKNGKICNLDINEKDNFPIGATAAVMWAAAKRFNTIEEKVYDQDDDLKLYENEAFLNGVP